MLIIMNNVGDKTTEYIKIRHLVFDTSDRHKIMHSLQRISDIASVVKLIFNIISFTDLHGEVVHRLQTYILILFKFVMSIHLIDHVLQTKLIINTLKTNGTKGYFIKVFENIISAFSWWCFIFIHNLSISKEFLVRIRYRIN
jgi:hypothetical protein